ncbi:MAG: nuclease-related domain-containing protein [Ekhidna sp.]|nr:nuclease-related domain-containing protein [Ekhidna sp.]
MAQIIGQIESLKKIRWELSQNNITRFNSISEINYFLKNYESELYEIHQVEKYKLNDEVNNLELALLALNKQYEKSKNQVTDKLNSQISSLNEKINRLKSSKSNFFFVRLFNWLQLKVAESKQYSLKRDFVRIIERKTNNIKDKVNEKSARIDELTQNKEGIISLRCQSQITQIAHTKRVVESLSPLIAGAIGENLVVEELKKLSDDYIVINDFSLNFNPPIYNRKDNDRIFSIQIDHLLITKSGIFIIETKNWSRKSIKRLDLRSPIEQIKRTSYALFVTLNSDSAHSDLNLNNHHWGKKQIPIRNVVVMINEKPKERFNYVSIKCLYELIDYITYFDPAFTDSEFKNIFNYLSERINNTTTSYYNIHFS